MKIGLVGPLPPPFGGMANQARQLHALLRSEGLETVFVQTNAPYRPRMVGRVPGLRALFRMVPYLFRLWRLAGRVDLIHLLANSGWSWQLFAAPCIWIATLRGTPVIVNYRGGEARTYFGQAWGRVRPTLARAQRVVVPSGYLKQVFADFGVAAEVVPNIIDLQRFAPAEAEERAPGDGPRLAVTRNLEPIYGIDTAIRAVALLRPEWPGIRLWIAGSGPQKGELQALAEQLGVADQVRFTGRLAPDEVAGLYRDTDIVLNPTTVDNMPNSILEALASGTPVVSTDAGGIPWMVENGVSALLVGVGDAEGMADQVRRLLTDRALYDRLVSNGLREVRKYAWPSVREGWMRVYRAVARGS
ncbi:MAG TPA: glycosyltransferase family 1 protein [Sedimenticola sp.]|nr:glycosyltransferase family 1 protein [Sedimenticola sp.]